MAFFNPTQLKMDDCLNFTQPVYGLYISISLVFHLFQRGHQIKKKRLGGHQIKNRDSSSPDWSFMDLPKGENREGW